MTPPQQFPIHIQKLYFIFSRFSLQLQNMHYSWLKFPVILKFKYFTLSFILFSLQFELKTSILPIGFLRIGLYLERAFLFKVLADRLGFPCSLVRGTQGRSWIEVAVPNLPPAPRPAYPTSLQRPNFLVDLIHSPGSLLPLNSYEANKYKGIFM